MWTLQWREPSVGYVFTLNPNGPPICWKSQKQATVALSSCEAEYMALAATIQEALFLYQLLGRFINQRSVSIHADNQGTISLASRRSTEKRSKHIDIRYHFLREKVASGFIQLSYVPSGDNVADIMTKPCSKVHLQKHCGLLFGKWLLRVMFVLLRHFLFWMLHKTFIFVLNSRGGVNVWS